MEPGGISEKEPVRDRISERTGSLCDRKALVVGLTGGIATGKTTVAKMLQSLGAKVVSADDIVHELLQPGTAIYEKVVHEFGPEILTETGEIDRQRLADIVFRDSAKRALLESIIHPPVLERLAEEANKFRNTAQGVLVLEVPLLIETSFVRQVDKVLVVTAEQATQVKRLQKRYGITREQAVLRIQSQLPMSEKVKYADWVIDTEGTMDDTRAQVENVWEIIQKSLANAK
jgi:dephospho-CoA kinase